MNIYIPSSRFCAASVNYSLNERATQLFSQGRYRHHLPPTVNSFSYVAPLVGEHNDISNFFLTH